MEGYRLLQIIISAAKVMTAAKAPAASAAKGMENSRTDTATSWLSAVRTHRGRGSSQMDLIRCIKPNSNILRSLQI